MNEVEFILHDRCHEEKPYLLFDFRTVRFKPLYFQLNRMLVYYFYVTNPCSLTENRDTACECAVLCMTDEFQIMMWVAEFFGLLVLLH
jgi:hypothetical protein